MKEAYHKLYKCFLVMAFALLSLIVQAQQKKSKGLPHRPAADSLPATLYGNVTVTGDNNEIIFIQNGPDKYRFDLRIEKDIKAFSSLLERQEGISKQLKKILHTDPTLKRIKGLLGNLLEKIGTGVPLQVFNVMLSQLIRENITLNDENTRLREKIDSLIAQNRYRFAQPRSLDKNIYQFGQLFHALNLIQVREFQLTKLVKEIRINVEYDPKNTDFFDQQLTVTAHYGCGKTNLLTAPSQSIPSQTTPLQLFPSASIGYGLLNHKLLSPFGFGIRMEGMILPFNTLTELANERRRVEQINMIFLSAEPILSFHSLGLTKNIPRRPLRTGIFASVGWTFSYPVLVFYHNFFSTEEKQSIQGNLIQSMTYRLGLECWSQSKNSFSQKKGKQLYIQYRPLELNFKDQGGAKASINQISIGFSCSLK